MAVAAALNLQRGVQVSLRGPIWKNDFMSAQEYNSIKWLWWQWSLSLNLHAEVTAQVSMLPWPAESRLAGAADLWE